MISEQIIILREKYVDQYTLGSHQEINSGLCPEFAEDLIEILGGSSDTFHSLCCDEFMRGENGEETENEVWDQNLLTTHWNITPPDGTTWQELDKMCIGYHVWIFFEGRYYDCECPDGVDNFFNLPFFDRWIKSHKGEKRGLVQ
jgi:hypothetical protein